MFLRLMLKNDDNLGLTDPSIRLPYEIGVLAYFSKIILFLEDCSIC